MSRFDPRSHKIKTGFDVDARALCAYAIANMTMLGGVWDKEAWEAANL